MTPLIMKSKVEANGFRNEMVDIEESKSNFLGRKLCYVLAESTELFVYRTWVLPMKNMHRMHDDSVIALKPLFLLYVFPSVLSGATLNSRFIFVVLYF